VSSRQQARKLDALVDRRYLERGRVTSLIPFFGVTKIGEPGEEGWDIRMVWDAKKNLFNESVFVPSFCLPTLSSYLNYVYPTSYSADLDVGEAFLNFPMHESARRYFGVSIEESSQEEATLLRHCRLCFGSKFAPYLACQGIARSLEFCVGGPAKSEPLTQGNVFQAFSVEEERVEQFPVTLRPDLLTRYWLV